tara:strand:+ start:123 stop:617 length:495 start_codon:yes stop_codon:yes gene_type:complete
MSVIGCDVESFTIEGEGNPVGPLDIVDNLNQIPRRVKIVYRALPSEGVVYATSIVGNEVVGLEGWLGVDGMLDEGDEAVPVEIGNATRAIVREEKSIVLVIIVGRADATGIGHDKVNLLVIDVVSPDFTGSDIGEVKVGPTVPGRTVASLIARTYNFPLGSLLN